MAAMVAAGLVRSPQNINRPQ